MSTPESELYPVFEIEDELEDIDDEEATYGRSVYFDWATGDFPLRGGQLIERTGHEAWLDWCVKCVRTQRFAFLAYTEDYGVDMEGAVEAVGREMVETELESEIADALEADPRTERTYAYSFEWQGDELAISFTIEPTIGPPEKVDIRHTGLV